MSRTDSSELISKIDTLAHTLGGHTSLLSDPDAGADYCTKFKASAVRVHERYKILVKEVSRQKHLTHEIESIFDNFFVVEAAIFEVRNNLKKDDFRKLPLVSTGTGKNVLRLYYIFSKLIISTNRILDKEMVEAFLSTYQQYSPLSVRELYAIPAVLQVVFVEHFGTLIERAIKSLGEYEEAGIIAKKLRKELGHKSSHNVSLTISWLASRYALIPMSLGFYLFQYLSQEGSAMRPVLRWLKLNFEKQGIDTRNLIEIENRQRSENSTIASNIIESLHWLTQARWENIVEDVNIVDSILSKDPAEAYPNMDLESKNLYRRVIVRIAETAGIHEAEVARTAVRLSQQSTKNTSTAETHVGYYLVDEGRSILNKRINYKPTFRDFVYSNVTKKATPFYFGTVVSLNVIFTSTFIYFLSLYGIGVKELILLSILVFGLGSEIAISIVNVFVARFLPVRRLPSLELLNGITERQRTFVVVPTMFRGEDSIRETVRKLEIRFLGNRQENILYALLFDFKDSSKEFLPGDDDLVKIAEREIETLNDRYSQSGNKKTFFILYRKRVWNDKEGVYMGWERKRGKLREFNMLLRGATGTTYVNEGVVKSLPHIRYIITLDEDTELPHDSARKLIGSIDHPLNRPVFSEQKNALIRGYGIIQPRVSVRLSVSTKSLYSRLYSATSGIDSYSTAVSDLYQDLFGNALFFGKGIYDIDAVENTMRGQIPDNLVLSHDLLEGIYARTGYASGVVLFDGFPKFYHEFSIRMHRWIRGDWQIIGWLAKVHKPVAGDRERVFSFVDRFKIFDNLRRSLVPVFAFALLVFGLISPSISFAVSLFVLFTLSIPSLASLINDLISIKKIPFRIRLVDTFRQVVSVSNHSILRVLFLLHHASISISAVVTTIWRFFVTRKRLLEWQVSTDVGAKLVGRLREFYKTMLVTQVIPVAYISYVFYVDSINISVSLFMVIWLLSPLAAFFISRVKSDTIKLSKKDERLLRNLAYKTSRYFLDLSRRENNWLIQDHYQEYPKTADTDRLTTSPTNLGMLFSSLFSSYDLGFLPFDRFIDRTRRAFVSLSKLDRFKGHLYNWYDIKTLEPLAPAYLSTVDSANFVVALVAFKQGVKEMPKHSVLNMRSIKGIEDGLNCVLGETREILSNRFENKMAKNLVLNVHNLSLAACEYIKNCHTPKKSSDFQKIFAQIHTYVVSIEKAATLVRAEESVRRTEQMFNFVESVSKLVEEEIAFQRYVLPHAHVQNNSIGTYIAKDANLLNVYKELLNITDSIPTLWGAAYEVLDQARKIDFIKAVEESNLLPESKEYVLAWHGALLRDIEKSQNRTREFLEDIGWIIKDCDRFIDEADFGFLYNKERGLFHIGYNVTYNRLDNACYNFLASESNMISFIAILKNQAPQKHWFYLGRKLVRSGSKISLVSWGGSLFEYLTSLIYFKTHKESLLGKTASSAIAIHKHHGFVRRTPWGMGESAYYMFDSGKHYQYQVFGSPEIGLKRGLADYLVVAPYVSALALSFVTKSAAKNLRNIIRLGGSGFFGLFDALDYMNEERIRTSKPLAAKTYYAHHQGFTMLSIHNVLDKDRIRNLFHADPRVASLEILLEEKMPTTPAATALAIPARLPFTAAQGVSDDGSESKQYVPTKTAYPYTALLGNGSYSVQLSNSGSGLSKYKGIALTRFRDDSLLEESGTFFYIRNEKTKTVWSPTNRPLGGDTKRHKVIFHENKAEFQASNGVFSSHLEVTVSPENPVEVRSLSITNNSDSTEKITVSSYGEVVLASQSQDMHHPQYQKLLVKSVFLSEYNAIVYSRPHPNDRAKKIFFAHMLSRNGFWKEPVIPCADRDIFIGRSRSIKDPAFFDSASNLTDSKSIAAYTLDPIFSLSRRVEIKAGETTKFTFINIAHEDYEELLKLMKHFRKTRPSMSVINNSLSSSANTTKKLGITQEMAVVFQKLASRALGGKQYELKDIPVSPLPYIHSLWKLGISGDYPIVSVVIKDIEDVQTVKHALLCHAYWKYKGLQIDLVIVNKEPASYIKVLDDEIDFLLRQSRGNKTDLTGGSVYHVKSDLIEDIDKKVLLHLSRVVLDSSEGTFKQQVHVALRRSIAVDYPAKHIPALRLGSLSTKTDSKSESKEISMPDGLEFKNQWGGFDSKKSEYVMVLSSQVLPPAPWSNIIASPEFGTVVTESGSMFTWSKDSYDNRLTTWNNDPIVFKSSEIFYLRDEETGEVWNPTPLPIKNKQLYTVKHGKGYTTFEHNKGNLSCSMEVSVSPEHPIKIVTLTFENTGVKKKNLSVTAFLEPTMNISNDHTRDFIDFEIDPVTGALLFKRFYRNLLPDAVAFADLGPGSFSVTTDRTEFLGRHGSYEHPIALKRTGLSNKIILGTTNCAALQSSVTINPKEKKVVTFLLGDADNKKEAENLINTYRARQNVDVAKAATLNTWKDLNRSLEINTPDAELNALFNHQLLYQVKSSRLWAKTGFYQPSGAFGFRDQLQDITAFVWSSPQDVRDFILKAARHQFKEGDALNWWHDHNMFGIRTALSDHQLWLVYATLEYISVTGDDAILNEEVYFLESTQPSFNYQREWAGTPKVSSEKGTLYEHCVRALAKSSVLGKHGLPLIGMSDWNDGLSNAGVRGKGESVWNGWFLGHLLNRFADIARKMGKTQEAEDYVSYATALAHALEQNAWDGKWYRRVFLDSGVVLGSRKLREFKIDSIAQSWASLSGLGREDRRLKALDSMFNELYDGDAMRLLAPALIESLFDPGYVKDYPPGVRENGSQYNHAALWAAQALFKEGMSDNAKKIIDSVNPFKRSGSVDGARMYRVEPYVVASDIYAKPSYKGRGGWTWYTGSAGVMYKTILQFMLGVQVEGITISFKPSLPTDWKGASVTYRRAGTVNVTTYVISYEKPQGLFGTVSEVYENGKKLAGEKVICVDDGKVHHIRVVLQGQ